LKHYVNQWLAVNPSAPRLSVSEVIALRKQGKRDIEVQTRSDAVAVLNALGLPMDEAAALVAMTTLSSSTPCFI